VIHLDSSFLIDLLRETSRERPAAAWDFIEALEPSEILGVSIHVICELRAGAELSRRALQEHETLDQLLSSLLVSYPDERFAPVYARLVASTTRAGKTGSAMDTLIAASALVDDAALVTRNVKDFSKIPGLRVLSY
jgi:predicted nucleic acid-binding protein